jgi:hypothetical protein
LSPGGQIQTSKDFFLWKVKKEIVEEENIILFVNESRKKHAFVRTVKPVFYDHPKIVAVVDRWSLFIGHICDKSLNWDLKLMVVLNRW